MTRKDFILISSAIRATQERIKADPKIKVHQQRDLDHQLRGVRRTAAHICDALLAECGRAFDAERFLTDCGYGAAERGAAIHEKIEDDLRPLPDEKETLIEYQHRNNWRIQQEANRTWSVMQGLAFRKGGFSAQHEATNWMNDYTERMREVS